MGLVALVGRPNVGKSALFNRLTETRRAIVEDFEGVTRDRLYEETEWNGMPLTVVDTGGIWVDGTDTSILAMTGRQTDIAIDEADVIVWVVDGISGPTAADDMVADKLRRSGKPVIVAVNKAESPRVKGIEFYRYGFGEPIPVSAVHGEGIGDLLDQIVERMPLPVEADREETADIRIALAGRPNVGKSSLVNRLSGIERTLVTPVAGTTRDVVDTVIVRNQRRYVLLDTAGLRRPDRITEVLEKKTVQRTLDAIRQADVVLMMVAAQEPITAQDQRIAGQVAQARRAVVVLLNKADLVKGTTIPIQKALREELKFIPYASIVPISVQTGWHLEQIWPEIDRAYQSYTTRLATHILNQTVDSAIHLNPPPSDKGRTLKIYYATQVSVRPPHIVFFVNDPNLVHFSYERYLENRLREEFDFQGSPLRLTFRARRREERG